MEYKTKNSDGGGCALQLGGGVGFWLAAILSYAMYKDIGWAIVHGIFSWLTVLYWLIDNNAKFFEIINRLWSLIAGG